jgi:NADH-quinone oxidoreductase subunit M
MTMPWLSILLWLPMLAAILIVVAPTHNPKVFRGIATVAGLLMLALSVALTWTGAPQLLEAPARTFLFQESVEWMPALGITYKLGVDGLSLPMVLLTGIISAAVLMMSHRVAQRQREFYALTLVAICGSIGTFLTVDLFFFILFYELASIPMFFLVGIWGSDKSGGGRSITKNGAATKLLIYLQAGGGMVLLGLMGTYFVAGVNSFDLEALRTVHFSAGWEKILFAFLFIGFGIESGLFPFHTWLPDGHSCAPTSLSMLLAGVLLKMGGYGILRFAFELFPSGAAWWMPVFAVFGVINLVYGGFCALRQTDIKVMIAYSSVSHMGMVFLGMACINASTRSGAMFGLTGSVFQMFSHGIITALLFGVAGTLYEVTHARDFRKWGGLAARTPRFAVFFVIGALASLGLPGFTGFPSELSVFLGLFQTNQALCVVAIFGLILTTTYLLRAVQFGFYGPLNPALTEVRDADLTETVVFSVLTFTTLIFGLYPQPLVAIFQSALQNLGGGISI